MERRLGNQQFFDLIDQENKLDIGSLKVLLEQFYGETNYLDFKEKIIEVHKLSKEILAMANSGGGTIIFGITDKTNEAVGINEEEVGDTTILEKKLRNIIPDDLQFDPQFIRFQENKAYLNLSGKTFFIIYVANNEKHIPYLAKKATTGIEPNRIYIRRNASIEEANNHEIEVMISKRIHSVYKELSYLDLKEHLEQLKTLYSYVPQYIMKSPFEHISKIGIYTKENNPYFPNESFNEFIKKIIEKKKRKVEKILEVEID